MTRLDPVAATVLATLVEIDRQLPNRWPWSFSAMRQSTGEKTIFRPEMPRAIHVDQRVLDDLAQAGCIRWMTRGVGVETFVLTARDIPAVAPTAVPST